MIYEMKEFHAKIYDVAVGDVENLCLTVDYGDGHPVEHFGDQDFCSQSTEIKKEDGSFAENLLRTPMDFQRTFTSSGKCWKFLKNSD